MGVLWKTSNGGTMAVSVEMGVMRG